MMVPPIPETGTILLSERGLGELAAWQDRKGVKT